MKLMGIDYGSKRVGIALSDDGGEMAFPKEVLLNDKNFFENIKKIVLENNVEIIILGESLDFQNKPNAIMKEVNPFKEKMEEEFKLPVFFEPEFMTSQEAVHIQGEKKSIDASAAALILQSYIDKNK